KSSVPPEQSAGSPGSGNSSAASTSTPLVASKVTLLLHSAGAVGASVRKFSSAGGLVVVPPLSGELLHPIRMAAVIAGVRYAIGFMLRPLSWVRTELAHSSSPRPSMMRCRRGRGHPSPPPRPSLVSRRQPQHPLDRRLGNRAERSRKRQLSSGLGNYPAR